ncbi:MAG: 1,6-anhydro-N-acetylmuramyl-L-alanine amidase AmpD [Gammaproteobacteria bacterium]
MTPPPFTLNAAGRISPARFVPSPNCDARPPRAQIDALIIHAISLPPGEYGGDFIEQFFTNRLDQSAHPYFAEIAETAVSAHFLIRRDGALLQFAPTHARAWHAGVSVLHGRARVNDFSLGIELEGCDAGPFEDAQYEILAALARVLIAHFPAITPERIVGHSDIAPGRKTDPGPHFDWPRLRRALFLPEIPAPEPPAQPRQI